MKQASARARSFRASRGTLATVLLLVAQLASLASAGRVAKRSQLSPVTRVVELLQSLQKKVEHEAKVEEGLYDKFVCWAKGIISARTASNAAAGARMDTLNTYVADLNTGRIELTSERTDLEKDIEQLHADMELTASMRDNEEKDFLSAKDQMEKAIAALTAAIDILTKATKGHEKGVLLGLRGQVRVGTRAWAAEAASLSHAVELGDKFLTKGDAIFLRRLLTGEVPTWDWKKLNRAATFKKGYKARSFKIQSILAKLLETFETNLAEAKAKEKGAKSMFSSLMSSKGNEKSSAQEALSKLEKENGAKGMSLVESEEELQALDTQVTDDKSYIAQVQKALEDKRKEWDDRKALRAGELEAISKAVSILRSDDARDLFKKSFKSQGYSLLQEEASALRTWRSGAAGALRAAAHAAHDQRLARLASHLAAGGHFDDVLTAIDTMLALLKSEESSDLEKKEMCEADRSKDTRAVALASRQMDDSTDSITSLLEEIKDLTENIKGKQQEVEEIDAELAESAKQRKAENADYLVAKKDDEDAKQLVVSASQVLSSFYKDNNLMLAQRQPEQPGMAAGEAPPPPPPTWEAPYGGKTGESTGIIAVLKMISEDIARDLADAASAEAKALALYTKVKAALEKEKSGLTSMIASLEITKGEKEQEVETTTAQRRLTKGSVQALMKKIADAEPGCNFFTVNFPVRSKNRQVEVDGLEKAKAILSGARFAEPEDPTRELKPGDA